MLKRDIVSISEGNNSAKIIFDFLSRNKFSSSKDSLKEYSANSVLYYCQVGPTKFLVINHSNYNRGSGIQKGFDLWLSEYKRASDIGSELSESILSIKKNIRFPHDSMLINQYLRKILPATEKNIE